MFVKIGISFLKKRKALLRLDVLLFIFLYAFALLSGFLISSRAYFYFERAIFCGGSHL